MAEEWHLALPDGRMVIRLPKHMDPDLARMLLAEVNGPTVYERLRTGWQRTLKAVTYALEDTASAEFPECVECGARPGQAHDPTCPLRFPTARRFLAELRDAGYTVTPLNEGPGALHSRERKEPNAHPEHPEQAVERQARPTRHDDHSG